MNTKLESAFFRGFLKTAGMMANNAGTTSLASPTKSPSITPPSTTVPQPDHTGWKLKGYTGGSGGMGVKDNSTEYTYQTPQGTFEHTSKPINETDLPNYNKVTGTTPYQPIRKDPVYTYNDIATGLRSGSEMSNKSTPYNNISYNSSNDEVSKDFIGRAIPRLNPNMLNHQPQVPYEQERLNVSSNINRDVNLRNILNNLDPGLTQMLNSGDEGIQENGLNKLHSWLNNLATQNPRLAQEVVHRLMLNNYNS